MRVITRDGQNYFLRFDRGEEVVAQLQAWCRAEGITGGMFSGIGACGEVTLSYYHLADKEYRDETIVEDLEISSLLGNIALLGGQVAAHAHGTFADASLRVRGGHVKRLVVSATCELAFRSLPGQVLRALDPSTGLNLLV
ncbi:MAG: DUF296 domain-containing protein [bacterium]|nr:DUF296 domain-containing protein [bacterium]